VGAEVMMVKVSGSGDHAVIIATNNRDSRPSDLAAHEVAIHGWYDDGQAQARFRPDGSLDLIAKTGKTVNLNGSSEALVLGDSFFTAFNAYLKALLIYIVIPLPSSDQTTTFTTAQLTFIGAQGSEFLAYKSTKTKTG